MKLQLITMGKTDDAKLKELMTKYQKRLGHYCSFELIELPDLKNTKHLTKAQQKQKEGDVLLKQLKKEATVLLFDENGQQYSSTGFSHLLQKQMNSGARQLSFVVGGPYGFSEAVYLRANGSISLSKMTFSHQMVRLFIVEQLYRAFSILRNEPYHHD